MQRLGCKILPILSNASSYVIISSLHVYAFFIKQRCNRLADRTTIACLPPKHVRVRKYHTEFTRVDSILSAYLMNTTCCTSHGKLSNTESIEQKHVCIIVAEEQSVTTVPR